jgi:hypothetical protein
MDEIFSNFINIHCRHYSKMRQRRKALVMTVHTATYFTSRASAMIPAASGAEAEVPVCLMVQVFLRSVVACEVNRNKYNEGFRAVGN